MQSNSATELSVACNLCGADDYTVVFKAGEAQKSQIVRCNQCSLMYANPRSKPPDVEQVSQWDPSFDIFSQPWFQKRIDKEKLQVRDYTKTRREMGYEFPNRGHVLEVGFSMGYGLVEWQKEGWNVTGVEPWKGGMHFAKEKLGLADVHDTTLRDAHFPDNSFDIVVMLHVIEHLDDPLGELKEIQRVLKPNGCAIVETPCYDTLMFKLFGRRERSVSCDGHIYFFTKKTLAAMGEKAGMLTHAVQAVGRSLTAHRLLWNVGVMSKSRSIEQGLDSISRNLGLGHLRFQVNTRDMQRITFRKLD